MGLIDKKQHDRFLDICPGIEKIIVDNGIILLKIWLEVGQDEQDARFSARINDPLRQWKLSPMDLLSYQRWYDYSRARDDKRRARLNCISHILSMIPYKKLKREKVRLSARSNKGKYDDQASLRGKNFVAEVY